MADRLFVTCEHAGNVVPKEYAHLFVGHEHLLPTHRGWDPGALLLAREMAERLGAPLYFDKTTRLLADLIAQRRQGRPPTSRPAHACLGQGEHQGRAWFPVRSTSIAVTSREAARDPAPLPTPLARDPVGVFATRRVRPMLRRLGQSQSVFRGCLTGITIKRPVPHARTRLRER